MPYFALTGAYCLCYTKTKERVIFVLPLKLGCLVMAAGSATRFGENKLAVRFGGKLLIERIFEAVPAEKFSSRAVVTQYDEIEALAPRFGFSCVRNDSPELGISRTIRLGLEALKDCDAVLFCVADQPLLRRETIAAEVDFFLQHPENIVALSSRGKRGNPCLFPARFFPELMALEGDNGGRSVIARHEDAVLLCEVREEELIDVDTVEALDALTCASHREDRAPSVP